MARRSSAAVRASGVRFSPQASCSFRGRGSAEDESAVLVPPSGKTGGCATFSACQCWPPSNTYHDQCRPCDNGIQAPPNTSDSPPEDLGALKLVVDVVEVDHADDSSRQPGYAKIRPAELPIVDDLSRLGA